ncbi:MAG: tetratricopeptide repeat protein [Verrucomicrobiae bacterium]|nr:tetratricopeptide repeat protein [Verrucomicrobiae bacterium]
MRDLEPPDSHFLNAARGWLGLGLPEEARSELNQLSPEAQLHPAVLTVEWERYAHLRDWTAALRIADRLLAIDNSLPAGWINRSYALHELRRTHEARTALLAALPRFPSVGVIHYNLACYACHLGDLPEARTWLRQAMAIEGREVILERARTDADLDPIRHELSGL